MPPAAPGARRAGNSLNPNPFHLIENGNDQMADEGSIITDMGLGPWGFLAAYLLIVIALGCIIDSVSIMLIMLPIVLPIATAFHMDLIWFGVLTVLAVEIGLLTPPFGLSAYVVKSSLNDPRITLGDIFRGTGPFTLIMVGVLLLLMAFPSLSLVLLK